MIYFGCAVRRLSLVMASEGYSLVAVLWLLIAMASLIEEHRLWGTRASIVVARRP